jgi:hypothetical protein
MSIEMISSDENTATFQVTFNFNNSMLDSENAIQDKLNEVGTLATGALLQTFDADGSSIIIGPTKMTSKGLIPKTYQTPYGAVEIERHVYQGPGGGATFCPLERDARIIITSTPRFAKQISHKFAENASTQTQKDLEMNHNRQVARSYLQNVAEAVGKIVLAKEESWNYEPKTLGKPVKTVSVGLDGTCMLLCKDGYRQAMVGTVSLYDRKGDRQHTTYIAAPPEYGKKTFIKKLERIVELAKEKYPKATFIGIADGAKDNWTFLDRHTDEQTIDFWHAAEYLSMASEVLHPKNKKQREVWYEDKRHDLKHKYHTAARVMTELKAYIDNNKVSMVHKEKAKKVLTYYQNNKHMMNYPDRLKKDQPMGSGVTEAACKVIVKQRLCKSGAKWKNKGAGIVLSLRCLSRSEGYWDHFWGKVNQYGFPVAA